MKILVTGCGRSGTAYIRLLLRRHGLKLANEQETVARNGIVDWHYVFGHNFDKFDVKLHQIRAPLPCIASCHTIGPHSWPYICKHVAQMDMGDSVLLKSMKYWYYWNLAAEEKCDHSYRIENLPEIFDKFCWWVGVEPDYKKLRKLPTNINTRRKFHITINDMKNADEKLFFDIQELAKHYGYTLKDK